MIGYNEHGQQVTIISFGALSFQALIDPGSPCNYITPATARALRLKDNGRTKGGYACCDANFILDGIPLSGEFVKKDIGSFSVIVGYGKPLDHESGGHKKGPLSEPFKL